MSAHPSPERLRQLAEHLARPRQEIEQAFLATGARLSESATLLNKLSKLLEALPQSLKGEDVAKASGYLEAVASRAGMLSQRSEGERANLLHLRDVVAAAHSPIDDLKRTVKMMGIVSINARVTAAGIVGNNEGFDVFTTDIAELSATANRTIQDFAQVYRQLTAAVDQAAAQRDRFDSAHGNTLTELSQQLSLTLESLAAQRALATESSAETGRVSRQIVGRIASAVMALQTGDSTRQRLEHTEAGLSCMADLAAGEAVHGQTLAEDERQTALSALATLHQAQLGATAAEFSAEIERSEGELLALASDAEVIMARSRDVGGGTTGKGSAMAALSRELRSAVAMLRDFEAERTKLEAMAKAVKETVGTLLDHVEAVQEIEANMRLVSLNAAVRCAQLGPRGASLTVIAMQLRELTTETVVAAETAMQKLNEASTLASTFSTGDPASQSGNLEDDANLALTIFTELDHRIADALGQLLGDGPKVMALLDRAAQGLSGQSGIAETLHDLVLEVASLGTEVDTTALSEPLRHVLDALRKSYTMEAERQIHDGLFPGMKLEAANDVAGSTDDDLADFML